MAERNLTGTVSMIAIFTQPCCREIDVGTSGSER
jgi:hypothetical protein